MRPELNDNDWREAFGYAGEPETEVARQRRDVSVTRCEGAPATVSVAPFTREDVSTVIALEPGENDGPSWIGVFRLADGRFAFLSAGCDYTGWDCQASGAAVVSDDLEQLIRLGLGDDDRERLGFANLHRHCHRTDGVD